MKYLGKLAGKFPKNLLGNQYISPQYGALSKMRFPFSVSVGYSKKITTHP